MSIENVACRVLYKIVFHWNAICTFLRLSIYWSFLWAVLWKRLIFVLLAHNWITQTPASSPLFHIFVISVFWKWDTSTATVLYLHCISICRCVNPTTRVRNSSYCTAHHKKSGQQYLWNEKSCKKDRIFRSILQICNFDCWISGLLLGSHGLSAQRTQTTKSSRPKGLPARSQGPEGPLTSSKL